jgi:hypothetical protein
MASTILYILFTIWLVFLAIMFFKDLGKFLAENTTSKPTRFIRRWYWVHIKDKLRSQYDNSYYTKFVHVRLMKYLQNSPVVKKFYIEQGYDALRYIMIDKILDYIKQGDKWKYNDFDELDIDEEEFIDNYLKNQKKDGKDTNH